MHDGKWIYRLYEAGGAELLTPWEHLTNEERARWNHVAERIYDDLD